MNVNSALIVTSLVIFSTVISILYLRAKNNTAKQEVEYFGSFDKVLEAVKNEMVGILKDDFDLGLSDDEFDRLYKRKARINEALKNCVYGVDSAKAIVLDLIRTFISEKIPMDQVDRVLGMDEDSEPSTQVKFEILMYKYKRVYGKDALIKWVDKYNLNREREATDAINKTEKSYYITTDDLNDSYNREDIKLTEDEKIDVLATLVFQAYKGFGIIDTVREMNIDGLNMGTSGSIMNDGTIGGRIEAYDSNKAVWIYDRGKYIHLRFLSFGTEEELRRIIQLLVRWGNPEPLTAKHGYLVNTMYDKSRVLALRPPASEHWAAFIRKFTLSDVSPEALIIKSYTNRGDLAIGLIEMLMRGQITCGVTGRQGSGKTTLMSSMIRYIDPRYTIRVLEMAPELYLREIYPSRNILSVQETANVSAAELQDALKKSDAAVSIVGEVATDSIASRMIQMGQVASLFTIFSHHANTTKDLVLSLRNSLVNAGGFSDMSTAEKQVTDIVRVDIHLDYTPDGRRYIERITEIVQLPEGVPYPNYDENNPLHSMNAITKEYYTRSTDRIGFTTSDILVYDNDTCTYKAANRPSKVLENQIKRSLNYGACVKFEYMLLKEFGPDNESNETEEEYATRLIELENLVYKVSTEGELEVTEEISIPDRDYVEETKEVPTEFTIDRDNGEDEREDLYSIFYEDMYR